MTRVLLLKAELVNRPPRGLSRGCVENSNKTLSLSWHLLECPNDRLFQGNLFFLVMTTMSLIGRMKSSLSAEVGQLLPVGRSTSSCSSIHSPRQQRSIPPRPCGKWAMLRLVSGRPFFEMCCFHIWALPERGGGVKACQDGLEQFFPMFGGVCKVLP